MTKAEDNFTKEQEAAIVISFGEPQPSTAHFGPPNTLFFNNSASVSWIASFLPFCNTELAYRFTPPRIRHRRQDVVDKLPILRGEVPGGGQFCHGEREAGQYQADILGCMESGGDDDASLLASRRSRCSWSRDRGFAPTECSVPRREYRGSKPSWMPSGYSCWRYLLPA